ncbi:MAG: TIGR00269 family protein [Candidatus Aenigmatarchaeota archaeon]|nr:MAG: TIGR00269 family protein [Candidatus Aenigmarchaeota archaeon]
MRDNFIEYFENKVKKTIDDYKLVNKKDRTIVACSGGKDSTTTLYLLKKFGYNVEGLIIDLRIGEWSEKNLKNVKHFCEGLGVPLHVLDMRKEFGCSICYIRSGIQSKEKLNNCAICGVIKRWMLNKKARTLKGVRLATGHNLDDEAETVLMTFFKGKPEIMLGAGPHTTGIMDDKFVPRIKPLYFCSNKEVARYSKYRKFPVLYDPCPCSIGTYRRDIRMWLAELERHFPGIKDNIVNNFLALLPAIKKKYNPDRKLRYCSVCEEPSRNEICKRCEMIKILFS